MKVKALFIYPIKSLSGIKVPQATLLEKGFEYDRRWMLVDEQGNFITQRKHPQLSKIKVMLENDAIIVSALGEESMSIPLKISTGSAITATIWGTTVAALIASNEINDWFSEVIGFACQLVYMPENASRFVSPETKSTVSFADAYPYLVLGQSSMDDLNSRMEKPLPILRFRPNIVFSGGAPYEEDTWVAFSIGKADFTGIKPCVRCVFTTIDQETGTSGEEPLKTLSTYRNRGDGVIFGLNAIAKNFNTIEIGDKIVVHEIL